MHAVTSLVTADKTLLDELSDEVAGPGLVSSLGLLSALLLSQEQMAQGVATLSPVQLALDALQLSILNLEPAMASLAQTLRVDPQSSAPEALSSLTWNDLLSEAHSLAGEVASSVESQGISLDVLGLQSLLDLDADLVAMHEPLMSVVGLVDGNMSISVLGSESLSDPSSTDAHALSLAPEAEGSDVSQWFATNEGAQQSTDHAATQGDIVQGDVAEVSDAAHSTDSSLVEIAPLSTGGDAPAPGVDVVGEVASAVSSGVLEPVLNLVEALPEVLSPLVDGVEDVLESVGDTLGSVGDVVGDVVDLVGDVVEDLLTNPADLPQTLVDGLTDVLDSTTDTLASTVDLVGDTLTGLTGGLTGTLTNLIDALDGGGVLSGDGAELLSPVTGVVDGLLDGDTGLLSPVTDLVDSLPVVDALGDLGGEVQTAVDSVGSVVVDTVGEVASELPVVGDVLGTVLPIVQPTEDDQSGLLGGLLG